MAGVSSSSDRSVRRPLVLTGGPAVGKTVTGRTLAERRPRAAFIDVDDLRLLVVAGHEWLGPAGAVQRRLGASNACALGRRFLAAGFDVAIADVLTPETAAVYREQLPNCLVVQLRVPLAEARRRATTRPVWLTDAEFTDLHCVEAANPPPVDHSVDVAAYSLDEQVAAVEALWTTDSRAGSAR